MHRPETARGSRWRGACALALTTILAVLALATTVDAATYRGSLAGKRLNKPVVGMAATPSGAGYWLVASDGGVFTFGDAHFYGSTGAMRLQKPIVGMAATLSGRGYWLVASDGGVFTFGDARFHGSTGAMHLQKPIVGMARTRSGNGYWLVASDGGIFSFGDARFHGSTGAMRLARPIVGMARTAAGKGYWLVASDGGVFSFGDAHFYGSGRPAHLSRPVVSMSVAPGGKGYYMVAADGRVLAYGSAVYMGSATGMLGGQLAAAIIAAPKVGGYWITSQWGAVGSANSTGMHADPRLPRSGEAAIRNELVNRINTERVRRGLKPLTIDPLLSSYASAWAYHLAATNTWGHQDLSAILRNANGRLGQAGENLFAGAGPGATDAGTAHGALMVSDSHRENILVPEERLVGIGAACLNGKLVVVEDFGTPSGIPLLPHPEPPLQPFAASDPGGASC